MKYIDLGEDVFTNLNLPKVVNTSSEQIIFDASPVFWLEADAAFLTASAPGAAVDDFRWTSRFGPVVFRPFGLNKPKFVTVGSRTALRFGFDGLSTGSNGHNGALKPVSDVDLLTSSYTLAWVSRIPQQNTEGVTTPGGSIIGGGVGTGGFSMNYANATGRFDPRNQHGTTQAIANATSFQTGVPHLMVVSYDADDDDMVARVNGASWASNTNYGIDILSDPGNRRVRIGGRGDTSLADSHIADIAAIVMFDRAAHKDAQLQSAIETHFSAIRNAMAA